MIQHVDGSSSGLNNIRVDMEDEQCGIYMPIPTANANERTFSTLCDCSVLTNLSTLSPLMMYSVGCDAKRHLVLDDSAIPAAF
jgi:hypothetical protein